MANENPNPPEPAKDAPAKPDPFEARVKELELLVARLEREKTELELMHQELKTIVEGKRVFRPRRRASPAA